MEKEDVKVGQRVCAISFFNPVFGVVKEVCGENALIEGRDLFGETSVRAPIWSLEDWEN